MTHREGRIGANDQPRDLTVFQDIDHFLGVGCHGRWFAGWDGGERTP
jgi:hypothetical protein